jgi:hypothetical protein
VLSVSRPELVSFLHQQLREQRRADGETSGSVQALRTTPSQNRELSSANSIQLVLPLDRKHQKHNKKIMYDKGAVNSSQFISQFISIFKAIEAAEKIDLQLQSSGVRVIAVHVSPSSFDAMMLHPEWLRENDSDAMKQVLDAFSPSTSYALQIREAILKKKAEGWKLIILLSLRDDRLQLVNFS